MGKKLVIGITAEGSVNLLQGQIAYFKSLGYDIHLLAPWSERSATFCIKEGCEHLIIDIAREISLLQDFKTLISIIKIFTRIKPDIVNLGTPKVSLLGMIAAYFLKIPKRIYTCRGFRFEHEKGIKKKVLIFMEKITSFCAHEVICISNSVLELGIKNGVFSRSKSFVINKGSSNGINLDLFDPKNIKNVEKNSLKNKYKLNDLFVFGFIGRIIDRKGVNEMVQVFEKLYVVDNNVRLLLVGPFENDQISNKNLFNLIENHPGIINIGRVKQEEVPIYLSLMDIFVLPAWWEGFGNVLIQAAAMGIPVISTSATGSRDAVSDGFNGVLIPPKDSKQLYEAMMDLKFNHQKRKLFGQNGVIWAKNFNQKDIWNEINNRYQSIC